MTSQVDLCIAIYNEGDCHEHWALYFDDHQFDDKTLFSVKPSSPGQFCHTTETRHAQTLRDQDESIFICSVAADQENDILSIAEEIKIRDVGIEVWTSQQYVLDFLDVLEANGLIPMSMEYLGRREYIRGRVARARVDYAFRGD
ncbi:uncharacterized protein BO80DRAFT_27658 [Aspergillus ibericus CBS 121593]|uniref:Uncharacterized protein n=1 Tax=Aspergillus ibericus CBS 121593 TaxID=1448316 RepID=A0A395H4D6_9EURO|nr:hypothetical protein BO80DRAFT_27658 [Aspergillus ibericus CBS 121593]RAL02616.1 hypothetical protein BO80DRAFT_27658 [Aspergillus ibericus CBS 121593]